MAWVALMPTSQSKADAAAVAQLPPLLYDLTTVGFAAGTGGIIEIVIRRSALQMGKSLFDGFVRE